MVVIHKEPQFVLLAEKSWRRFACVRDGSLTVTLRSGRAVLLGFRLKWQTDMTTTPRAFLWALPQLGPHVPASVAHDLALELWKAGALTLDEAREIGFTVLDSLPDVGPLSRFFWKAGVWFKDRILRPFGF